MSNVINNRMSMDEIWDALAEYSDEELCDIVAKSNLSVSKLKTLIKGNDKLEYDDYRHILLGVIEHPKTTEQMLWDILCGDDTPYEVLPIVLENPDATDAMCEELIDMRDENIQIQIMTYDRFVDTWCDLADNGCSS